MWRGRANARPAYAGGKGGIGPCVARAHNPPDEPQRPPHPVPQDLQARVLAALAPYALRETGSNSYRANSPFRPNSNSHAFTLTLDAAGGGVWYAGIRLL